MSLYVPPLTSEQVKYRRKVRAIIVQGFRDMAEKFDGFEQTLHGVLSQGDIHSVVRALVEMGREPNAFNVSTFVQHVEKFRKRYGEQA